MKDSAANRSPTAPPGIFEVFLQRLGTGPLWIAAAAILLTVVFGELPGEGRYAGVLQDASHAPAFAVLSLIILTLLSRRQESTAAWRTRTATHTALVQAVVTLGAALLLGAATEGVQGLVGRDAEVTDVSSDVVGAISATSLWLNARLRPNANVGARIGRIGALLACAGMLAYWLHPLLQYANAYWNRDAQFPVLAQFRSQRDLYFLSGSVRSSRIVTLQLRANTGSPPTALQILLDTGRWPGITLSEPVPDWRGFRELALDLTNPGSTSVPLRLRISDRAHSGAFDDRFNTQIPVPPHTRTTIHIALERIALSPRTRRMDMSRICELILFRDGSAAGQVILVHKIWLQ